MGQNSPKTENFGTRISTLSQISRKYVRLNISATVFVVNGPPVKRAIADFMVM